MDIQQKTQHDCGKNRENANKIIVRLGTKEDKREVAEFTQSTFEWGDYVPDVFDEWVENSPDEGRVFVAVVAGRIVGVTHVRYLSHEEAWFEGIRVHPDFRRMGIGQKLTEASIQAARLKGNTICRVAIDSANEKSSRLAAKFGFQKAATNVEYFLEVSLDASQGLNSWPGIGSHQLNLAPGITIDKASVDRIDDVCSATELAKKSLTLIGCDFVWRRVTQLNMSSLAKDGSLWLAYRDGAVIAGAALGDFWVENDDESPFASENIKPPVLHWNLGSSFGDAKGIEGILYVVVNMAKEEASRRELNSIRLSLSLEEGSPVPIPLSFRRDESSSAMDIWELRLAP